MIAGYVDKHDAIFCADCWVKKRATGRSPDRVLDTEDPDDPGNNFWIVDNCVSCGREVKYQATRMLG
jgi:hypothetical protein